MVPVLWTGVLMVVVLTVKCVTPDYCQPWKWISVDPGQCQRCPGCKRGQFHDNSTISVPDPVRGALECHVCRPCAKGYYSDKHTRRWDGLRYCRLDVNCTKKNRSYLTTPVRSRRSRCGPCLDGYSPESMWDEKTGVCYGRPKVITVEKVTVLMATTTPTVQELSQGNNMRSIRDTVRSEADRTRDHQMQYGLLTVAVILVLLLIGVGIKFRKRLYCSVESPDVCEPEVPSSTTKLLAGDVPVVDVSVVDVSVVDVPVVDAPLLGAPVLGAPVLGVPVVDVSIVDAPLLGAPVLGAPFLGAPILDIPVLSTEHNGVLGTTFHIFCPVASLQHIQSVTWQRILRGISTDLYIDGQKYAGSTICNPTLIINNLSADDQAIYVCTVMNDVGISTSTPCFLKVIECTYPTSYYFKNCAQVQIGHGNTMTPGQGPTQDQTGYTDGNSKLLLTGEETKFMAIDYGGDLVYDDGKAGGKDTADTREVRVLDIAGDAVSCRVRELDH